MQHGGVSRIRLVDVPPPIRGSKTKDLVRRVVLNIEAGIGPQEAIDVEVPEPNNVNNNPSAGHYLLAAINKVIKERKLPVDTMRLEGKDSAGNRDGKWHIYVVGR